MGCGCGGTAASAVAAAMPSAQPVVGDPILWMARANNGQVQDGFTSPEAASTWVAAQGGGTVHAQAEGVTV